MTTRANIGLGCMRLQGVEPIVAALDAGVTLLDTARAYGESEALVGRAVSGRDVVVVTKAGMTRDGEKWVPDGRASAIREDLERSAQVLGRVPDVTLLHAPDSRVELATSVRALARGFADGLTRAVGLSNVSLPQVQAMQAVAPIAAVEVSLGAFDDTPLRSGLVRHCLDRGVLVLAHSPLGGVKKAAKLEGDTELLPVARRYGVSVGTLVLWWWRQLHPRLVMLPGARRVETARAAAAMLEVSEADRAVLERRFSAAARVFRPQAPVATRADAEVVMLMGIQGAGKTRAVSALVGRGYERLNRDEAGGSIADLAERLRDAVAAGGRFFVLDNTFVTRASRNRVLEVAHDAGIPARCVWMEVPMEDAHHNAVVRLVERYGRLPGPEELKALARKDPHAFAPTAQLRTLRELEAPTADEGFASIERVPFERAASAGRAGVIANLDDAAVPAHVVDEPVLLLAWRPNGVTEAERALASQPGVTLAVCEHEGGPPKCWCRPPMPGLVVAWSLANQIDLSLSRWVNPNPAWAPMIRACRPGPRPVSNGNADSNRDSS